MLEITARQLGSDWIATCVEIPELLGIGADAYEAVEDLEEAIEEFLRSRTLH